MIRMMLTACPPTPKRGTSEAHLSNRISANGGVDHA